MVKYPFDFGRKLFKISFFIPRVKSLNFQRSCRFHVASKCKMTVGSKNVSGMFFTYLIDSEFIPVAKEKSEMQIE